MRTLTAALTLGALTLTLLAPATAQAKRGIALISTGDKMFDIAEATPDSAARQEWPDAVVAYHAQHFGLFWLPIWTWDGKPVIYSDNAETYMDGTLEEISGATGVPVDQISKPFLYSFPLGLLIIVLLIIVAILYGVFARGGDDEQPESQPGPAPT